MTFPDTTNASGTSPFPTLFYYTRPTWHVKRRNLCSDSLHGFIPHAPDAPLSVRDLPPAYVGAQGPQEGEHDYTSIQTCMDRRTLLPSLYYGIRAKSRVPLLGAVPFANATV